MQALADALQAKVRPNPAPVPPIVETNQLTAVWSPQGTNAAITNLVIEIPPATNAVPTNLVVEVPSPTNTVVEIPPATNKPPVRVTQVRPSLTNRPPVEVVAFPGIVIQLLEEQPNFDISTKVALYPNNFAHPVDSVSHVPHRSPFSRDHIFDR